MTQRINQLELILTETTVAYQKIVDRIHEANKEKGSFGIFDRWEQKGHFVTCLRL